MFYYVVSTLTRKEKATPVFANSGPAATALIASIPAPTSDQHLGHLVVGAGGLEFIRIDKWVDKATYDAYQAANAVTISAYTNARNAYEGANNITHREVGFESNDILI